MCSLSGWQMRPQGTCPARETGERSAGCQQFRGCRNHWLPTVYLTRRGGGAGKEKNLPVLPRAVQQNNPVSNSTVALTRFGPRCGPAALWIHRAQRPQRSSTEGSEHTASSPGCPELLNRAARPHISLGAQPHPRCSQQCLCHLSCFHVEIILVLGSCVIGKQTKTLQFSQTFPVLHWAPVSGSAAPAAPGTGRGRGRRERPGPPCSPHGAPRRPHGAPRPARGTVEADGRLQLQLPHRPVPLGRRHRHRARTRLQRNGACAPALRAPAARGRCWAAGAPRRQAAGPCACPRGRGGNARSGRARGSRGSPGRAGHG